MERHTPRNDANVPSYAVKFEGQLAMEIARLAEAEAISPREVVRRSVSLYSYTKRQQSMLEPESTTKANRR